MSRHFFQVVFLLALCQTVGAQSVTVTGSVIDDASKAGVRDAMVGIPGGVSTVADDSGVFRLKLPATIHKGDDVRLRITRFGYDPLDKYITVSDLPLGFIKIRKTLQIAAKTIPEPPKDQQISILQYYKNEIHSNDIARQLNACKNLGGMGSTARPALPQLLDLILHGDHPEVTIAAINVLTQIGTKTPDLVVALQIVIKSPDVGVRIAGLEAIRKMRLQPNEVIYDLQEVAQDSNIKVSIWAIAALLDFRPQKAPFAAPFLAPGLRIADISTMDTAYQLLHYYDTLPSPLRDEIMHISGDSRLVSIFTETKGSYDGRDYDDLSRRMISKAVQTLYYFSQKKPDYVKRMLFGINLSSPNFQSAWPVQDSSDIGYAVRIFSYSSLNYPKEQVIAQMTKRGLYLKRFLLKESNEQNGTWALDPLLGLDSTLTLPLFDLVLKNADLDEMAVCLKLIQKYHLFSAYHVSILTDLAFRSELPESLFPIKGTKDFSNGVTAVKVYVADWALRQQLIGKIKDFSGDKAHFYFLLKEFDETPLLDTTVVSALWRKAVALDASFINDLLPIVTARLEREPRFFEESVSNFDSVSLQIRSCLFLAYSKAPNIDTNQVLLLIRKNLKNDETDYEAVNCLITLTQRSPRYEGELRNAVVLVRNKLLKIDIERAIKDMAPTSRPIKQ